MMDAATVRFHEALLRQLKGVLTAYSAWIDSQRVEATVAQLKQVKAERKRAAREPLDFPVGKK
jgi:hypothetical protein